MCRASRLSAFLGTLFIILLSIYRSHASALLVYDRQSLLNFKFAQEMLYNQRSGHQSCPPPPLLANIPAHLWRTPYPRSKRTRKRGKRGGVLLQVRAHLRSCKANTGLSSGHLVAQRCLRWIHHIESGEVHAGFQQQPPVVWMHRARKASHRGVNHRNLRMLARDSSARTGNIQIRLALLNVRSIANKTFLLNNFFVSKHLDFLFLTETWLRPGGCTAFSELLPSNCLFFNSPRSSGKGGGLASVFRTKHHCKQIYCRLAHMQALSCSFLKSKVPCLYSAPLSIDHLSSISTLFKSSRTLWLVLF